MGTKRFAKCFSTWVLLLTLFTKSDRTVGTSRQGAGEHPPAPCVSLTHGAKDIQPADGTPVHYLPRCCGRPE